MPTSDQSLDRFAEVLRASWPDRRFPTTLRDDLELGERGLGLDSVERFEVLVACEEQWDVALTETLLGADPLTVGQLIEHFGIR